MNRIARCLIAAIAFLVVGGFSIAAEVLVPTGATWKYFKGNTPPSSPDPTAWRTPGFPDSSWDSGVATFYYGDPFSGTALNDMQNTYSSVFLRREFALSNPADIESLTLTAACDDGFICWINGTEAMRFNVPEGEIPYDGFASGAVAPDPAVFNDYPVPNPRSLLVSGRNVIAVQLLNANLGSSDIVWEATLSSKEDTQPPLITSQTPPPGAAIRDLAAIEVVFSEPVSGVNATDLLINGQGATNVTEVASGQFVFTFPRPPAGTVTVSFRNGHGIVDLAGTPHPFAGGSWTYTVDPNLRIPGLILSEFMADNGGVIRDEDGDESDWIELFNTSPQSVSLLGWALTDDPANLGKWKFPNTTLAGGARLVVFASEKNRTAVPGRLHTNFKLSGNGEFLALVNPSGEVESGFSPVYPPQRRDVSYGRANGAPNVVGYFAQATPGAANSSSGSGFAPDVSFSRRGGGYQAEFQLTLSLASPDPAAVIRYTLDGTLPSETSPVYADPIAISGTRVVRARAFSTGLLPGEPRTEMYLRLDGTTPTFSSDLPVLVLNNYGKSTPPAEGQQPAYLHVFEPVNGVTSMTNPPSLSLRVGIGARGSSTLGYEKVSLNLELRNEFEEDRNRSLLGLPSDSDWVLYAPNNFEPILIHNPYAHQLARDLGAYSSRTRFVELFLITDSIGTIRYPGAYNGIYVLEERVRRSPDRVDVDKLEPEHLRAPEVTGGYLLKVDRTGPGEGGFSTPRQGMVYVEPSEAEIRQTARAAQRQYLQTHFNAFESTLYGANWKDPVTGYRSYIDVPAWIDYHLINVLTFNVDALRLSAYLYKPRNGKITFGPQWDFDRALNSTDGRDANPRVWCTPGSSQGAATDFFNDTTQAWWGRLFTDLEFYQQWIDRYQDLRDSHFATTNLHRLVDQLTDEVRKAQPRERTKWGRLAPPRGSFNTEISSLKTWLNNRVTFMDSQFVQRPRLSTPGGRFEGTTHVTLTGPSGAILYYTLDGTDPRLPGGAVSPSAQVAGVDPIVITANTRLVARANRESHTARTGTENPPLVSKWSGITAATFFNTLPPLRITEIQYHPEDPAAGSAWSDGDFEFIELANLSGSPLELAGFSLAGGIQYTFSASSGVTSLGAGARVLVVRNRTAFLERYPGATGIAGEFAGALGNDGNRIRLLGPVQEVIQDLTYDPGWAPLTDGVGFSLVPRDESADPATAGDASTWRQSARPGGSPGAVDADTATVSPVYVSEALTHTDPPMLDSIELFNPGNAPVAIGGWWLSDDLRSPKKYRIPQEVVLAPGDYWVVTETDFRAGPNGFSFSALGDSVHLYSADASGELTGWHHGFSFDASFNGVSFGRLITRDGREHFVPQRERTLNAANAGPRIGPVVLTEIHAEPPLDGVFNNTRQEFVEIRNVTSAPLPLFDPLHATNRWRLRGGVDFDFPPGATLPPGGFGLLVSFDPDWPSSPEVEFRAAFNVPADVPIWGPWEGVLDNAGETLELKQPEEPIADPPALRGQVPYVPIESIHYRTVASWPTNASGTGNSLQRLRSLDFGDEPANWEAAIPTPGRQNNAGDILDAPADADSDGLPDAWEIANGLNPASGIGVDGATGDPDLDGATNAEEYVAGTHPRRSDSVFAATIEPSDVAVQIRFPAVTGRRYTLWYSDSLSPLDWRELKSFGVQTADGVLTVSDTPATGIRYYAVTVALP